MKKTLSIAGIFLIVVTLIFICTAIVLSQFVDPNKYKGRISQFVYAKTGQVLVINGNMQWSIFPWVGLKAADLTYYNPPSYTPKTFVSAKEMDIKIKFLPLITGKIEIGNVTLNDAVLNLIKNSEGKFNWQSLTKNENKQTEIPEEGNHKSSSTLSALSIDSLRIKNGKLNWIDQQQKTTTNITELNINSKHIQFGQPFPLSLQFDLLNAEKKKLVSLDLSTDIELSSQYEKFTLGDIKLKGEYFNDDNTLNFRADGNFASDLTKQTLDSNLSFNIKNCKGQINVQGTEISKNPAILGTLTIDEFNLRGLLADAGKPLAMKDSKTFTSVSLLSSIGFKKGNIEVKNLHAKFDKTDLYGNLSILTDTKTAHFNLNANEITVDDYLPPSDSPKKAENNSQSIDLKDSKQKSAESPWAVDGTIKIAKLSASKLKLSEISTTMHMKNKVIYLSPLRANFYQGQLDGSVTIDKHQTNKTTIALKQTLKGVDIKQLLGEFSNSDKLSGSTNITADLTSTTGPNSDFLSGLNGKLQFSLLNGSVKGVDVAYQLSRAHAFIKHLPSPNMNDSKETKFSMLSANGVVTSGVINTDDIALTSDYLKVNGKGSTNLVNKDIHYRLEAQAQPKLADENKDIGKEVSVYKVPIKISGKLNKPSVNLDYAELAKIFIAKEIEKPLKENLQKGVNHLKDNLKDNLKEQVNETVKSFSPASLLNQFKHSGKESSH